MSNRILLPLAVLVGIIIGAVAFRPMAVAQAQVKPPVAKPPVIADPTLKPVPNDPTVKPAPAEVAKTGAKWEYKVVVSGVVPMDEGAINRLASEGYEYVEMMPVKETTNCHTIFKRPTKQAGRPIELLPGPEGAPGAR